MDFDLVIFDCDGVLVDSELLSCHCLSEALASNGIDAGVDVILDQFLGRSIDNILEHYRNAGCIFPDDFSITLAAHIRSAFAESLRPIPGVEATLRALSARCCVASSSDRERVAYTLALTGLAHFFDGHLYTAEMVLHGKPAPDLFLHAASAMGATPARTLVVEDSISGVQAGKAAGMTVWGFVGGSHYDRRDGKPALLAAGADLVFDRMADFHTLAARDGVPG
jgi:HAD superfamily hydrolase (TIGR01509 family)